MKFGEVCFLSDCTDLADDDTATAVPVGSGTGLVIPGGPGSTNFVPDNVVANPKMGIKARYYDVTPCPIEAPPRSPAQGRSIASLWTAAPSSMCGAAVAH